MNTFTQSSPRTMAEFLAQLREALRGSDPAMIQDALFDSEDYLRAAIADNAALSESEVMAKVLNDYGTPQEVAGNYRETDATVQAAIQPAAKPRIIANNQQPGWWRRVFNVLLDPHAYGSLFYMLLSVWTGMFYFAYVITGISMSLSTIILIFGIPLLILFLGSIRILALVEGRVVEALLGVRMPRRPSLPKDPSRSGWIPRIKGFFTDPRTWSTMLYLLLMLPLGVIYFSVSICLLAMALSFLLTPIAALFGEFQIDGVVVNMSHIQILGTDLTTSGWVMLPIFILLGVLCTLLLLHLARWVGKWHGALAKNLLVIRD